MTERRRRARAPAWWRHLGCGLLVATTWGCASDQKKDIVPERTRERSQKMYGQQEMYLNDMKQTPAEQAAEQHYDSTQPVERPGRETDPDEDD